MKLTGSMPVVFGIFLLSATIFSDADGHDWMPPKEVADRINPVVTEPGSIERGKVIYAENCAACHGERVEGLGAEQTGLSMASPNLRERVRSHSDGDFFWKVQHGRGEMPPFKADLSDEQIWDVINFLKHEAE